MPIRWSRIHAALGLTPQDLTYDLLSQAVEQGVAEADDLDWKQALPPKDEKKLREFAKDVASFANSRGGMLVYGVDERDEHAVHPPIGVDNGERARQRLRALAAQRIRPPVAGLQVVAFDGDAGQPGLLVVAVPASPDAPHVIGDDDALGIPYRDGTDTRWMREHQLERAYDERRQRRIRDEESLDILLGHVTGEIDTSAAVWVLVAARPRSPLSALLPKPGRGHVRTTVEDGRAVALEVAPDREGYDSVDVLDLLSENDLNNPGVGLRRWTVQRNRGTATPDQPGNLLQLELHHDGSMTLAVNVRDAEAHDGMAADGVPKVRAGVVESVIVDALALAAAHVRRLGGDGPIACEVRLLSPPDVPVMLTRKHRFEGLGQVPGSRLLRKVLPVTAEIASDADATEIRDVAAQLAQDILHQFGIENLVVIPPSTQ